MTAREPRFGDEARDAGDADTAAMLDDVEARGYVDARWADVILANGRREEARESAGTMPETAVAFEAGEPDDQGRPSVRQLPETIGGDCCDEEER